MPTCRQCGTKFPTKMVVDGKERNFQRRKFCITCSPLNSHNTRDILRGEYVCKICGEPCSARRTICNTCTVLIRKVRMKLKLIAYKGGKCEMCGWDKHPIGLTFHHLNGDDKDFMLGGSVKSWERQKAEVDKCQLLCHNCHRIVHATRWVKIAAYLESVDDLHGVIAQG